MQSIKLKNNIYLDTSGIYDSSLGKTQLDINNTIDNIIENYPFALTTTYMGAQYPTGNVGSTTSFTSSTAWRCTKVNVESGKRYLFRVITYNTSVYTVVFVDSNDVILAKYGVGQSAVEKDTFIDVVAPSEAVTCYVSKHSTVSQDKCEAYLLINNYARKRLRILCLNCGDFSHKRDEHETQTDQQYLQNYRQMLNDIDPDYCILSDATFGSQEYFTIDNIFSNTISGYYHITGCEGHYTFYKIPLYDPVKVDLTSSVVYDGSTYSAGNRNKSMRMVFNVSGKNIAIYSIHCAPNSGNGYIALRAQQYADLIADASSYDGAIFCGDFNAQTISEYSPFTNANYKLSNGGYIGTINTLRTIPADNIIVSNNILIRKIAIPTTYVLNSDHLPIISDIEII